MPGIKSQLLNAITFMSLVYFRRRRRRRRKRKGRRKREGGERGGAGRKRDWGRIGRKRRKL